jgi:transposase
MLIRKKRTGKSVVFAAPPWDEDSPQWQDFDGVLGADHIARQVVERVKAMDLSDLTQSYLGTGSRAFRPDLMLRIALIEVQRGRHSPSHWFQDNQENIALQWAGLGIQPSRTCWHEFAYRVSPFLLDFNRQILQQAQQQGQTTGARASLDGSLVGANGSRHQLLNAERLDKRLNQLQAALAVDETTAAETTPLADRSAPVPAAPSIALSAPLPVVPPADPAVPVPATPMPNPGWMARTPHGRQKQHQRYEKAREILQERLAANAERNPAKRQDAKKIVISVGDPEAALGRDKEKVFRPLYNCQLMCDLDSPFILSYDVFAQSSDASTLGPMVDRTAELVGHAPHTLLVDAGYVNGLDLAWCVDRNVVLHGPWQENDYSSKATEPTKQLPKEQFVWLPQENAYQCPQGHRLTPIGKEQRFHVDGRSEMQYRYRCAPAHCRECPLRKACTSNPERGRSLRRSEFEDLIVAHKARMETAEAKGLYKLRKQTVELGFADLKEHRRLRRLWGRGLERARAQVGFAVLAHNLLALESPTHRNNDPGVVVTPNEIGP